MKSEPLKAQVAIVGGGYSGTIAAGELARRGISSLLIEGGGRAGRGVAFSTLEPAHLLNVRAEGMSAWAEDPKHFARVFESEGGDARGFAERRLFGNYLRHILDDALATGLVTQVDERAISATRTEGRWRIELASGAIADAAAVVLAAGNQPPEPLPFGTSARFIIYRLSVV